MKAKPTNTTTAMQCYVEVGQNVTNYADRGGRAGY